MRDNVLRYFILIATIFSFAEKSFSQNVGIGITTPDAKAALDIQSTNKGVLFPRLTTAQRDAITNPPDGLHIYNRDEHCLNYYDSLFQVWNCYCENDSCKTVTIIIDQDAAAVNFYSSYASRYPNAKKFVIFISEDVTINGTATAAALSFFTMPATAASPLRIKIINYGAIYGIGGDGGRGAAGQVGAVCSIAAENGKKGGDAIFTNPYVAVTVLNHGLVAGGGGGGGGGGRSAEGQYGGGGGGGAGLLFSLGGAGGGATSYGICIPTCICSVTGGNIAGNGIGGTNVTAGGGGAGAGAIGIPIGGNAGNGGQLAQQGQAGSGTAAGVGGLPGKALTGSGGNPGNSITNVGGLSYGVVD